MQVSYFPLVYTDSTFGMLESLIMFQGNRKINAAS